MTAIAASAIVTAGCGSSNGAASPATTSRSGAQPVARCSKATCITTLNIGTDPNDLAFVPTNLTARAGKVTIIMTNDSAIQHSVAIRAPGDIPGQVVNEGQTSSTTATLTAGTYTYYCTVPGHAAAGMVGTLTVTG